MSTGDEQMNGARRRRALDLPEVPLAAPTPAERAAADRVLARYASFTRDQLLPLLLEVQAGAGWISEEMTRYLSQRLGVPYADLYGVVTFYALLTTVPAGATVIRVCNSVPCMLHGARALGERLRERLGVEAGTPTADGAVSWQWFACLGQCDHAPALLVGEEAMGDVTPEIVDAVAKEARHERADA